MYACDVPCCALVYGKPSESTLMILIFLFFPEYGVVAKITDAEFAMPAPKLTSCGSLEKLLNFSMYSFPVREVGPQ